MTTVELRRNKPKYVKRVAVESLFDAIPLAKDLVREAVAAGEHDPRVNIITLPYDEVWTVITKKDIVEKFYHPADLTEYELDTLKKIIMCYENEGIDNSDYSIVFPSGSRTRRGALSSLIQKQVVDSNICPGCFNPIFPVHNFISTCKKYNLDIPLCVKQYLGNGK